MTKSEAILPPPDPSELLPVPDFGELLPTPDFDALRLPIDDETLAIITQLERLEQEDDADA